MSIAIALAAFLAGYLAAAHRVGRDAFKRGARAGIELAKNPATRSCIAATAEQQVTTHMIEMEASK